MRKSWEALQRLAPDRVGQYHEYTDAERDEITAKVIGLMDAELAAIKAQIAAGEPFDSDEIAAMQASASEASEN